GEALLNLLRNRNRTGVGKAAIIEPGASDDVGDEVEVRVCELRIAQRFPYRIEIKLAHVRQDEILRMRRANVVKTVALGEVGHHLHLLGGDIAADAADRLQADIRDRIARRLVRDHLLVDPESKVGVRSVDLVREARFKGGRCKIGRDPVIFSLRKIGPESEKMLKLLLDLAAELFLAKVVDEDLHPLLVDIVAPRVKIPNAQDRLDVGENLRSGAEVTDLVGNEGG